MIRQFLLTIAVVMLTGPGFAQDKQFALVAPDDLVETGFLKHLLPRFSLKTGIRIDVNGPNPEATLSTQTGVPVFEDDSVLWRMEMTDTVETQAFFAWLQSDVGARTISAFQPDGAPLFRMAKTEEKATVAVALEGDAVKGEELSMTLCARCHVVDDRNRMKGLGSTPSFGVLRTLPGWLERFETFYVLRPHAAFTQITDVTPPFDPERPSPIVPIELTLDDLDAVMAFVQSISPADLGAPIQSQ